MVIGIVLIAAIAAGLYASWGRSPNSEGPALAPELAQGLALYEVHCLECLGESATGDGPLAASLPVPPPSILDHLVHHSEEVLVRIVQTGIPPAMPPIAVGDQEARLLFGYLESLLPPGQSIGSMGSMDMPMGSMPMDHEGMDMPGGGPG
jgi:mono/diheme cytochrome c family protein